VNTPRSTIPAHRDDAPTFFFKHIHPA